MPRGALPRACSSSRHKAALVHARHGEGARLQPWLCRRCLCQPLLQVDVLRGARILHILLVELLKSPPATQHRAKLSSVLPARHLESPASLLTLAPYPAASLTPPAPDPSCISTQSCHQSHRVSILALIPCTVHDFQPSACKALHWDLFQCCQEYAALGPCQPWLSPQASCLREEVPASGQVQAPHIWGDGRIQPGYPVPPALQERAPPSLPSQDSPYRLRQWLCGLLRDEDMTGKSVVSRVLGDEPKISEGRERGCDWTSRQAGTGTPTSLRCTHP